MLVAALLFFFSGAAGLIYEVVWLKILGLQFGGSAWAVSTVVSSFMAGLGLGSWWAGRQVRNLSRPFTVYALLELGIALFGLISIPLLYHLDAFIEPVYHALQDHFAVFALVRFLASFLLLLIPTFLMGASLPVLVVGLARQENFKETVGTLYGINTMGAAFGVLFSSFVLLPAAGMQPTLLTAVGMGIAVALAAILWEMASPMAAQMTPGAEVPSKVSVPFDLLAAACASGAISLFCEVAWTRLLMPVVGSSTYAFAIILVVFLFGIALGSLLVGSRFVQWQAYRAWIGVGFALAAIGIIATTFLINLLPEFLVMLAPLCGKRVWMLFACQLVLVNCLVLVPIFVFGAILPLTIVAYQAETKQMGRAVGGIYVANTLGAILGSWLAGFVFLPYMGVYRSMVLVASLSLVAGALIHLRETMWTRPRKIAHVIAFTAIFSLLQWWNPQIDMQHLHQGVFRDLFTTKQSPKDQGTLLFAEDGPTCTVTVYRFEDSTGLKVNGKPDASTSGDLATQYLLGHLPMFLNQSPKNVCVIGLGSGATVRAVATHPAELIDVVELEPAVVKACSWFTSINDNVLDDRRVRLHIEDGRSFLRYHRGTYDVIISEPSNPWVAGVSALFTSEFYRIVENRLGDNGVFCQWIQMYELSTDTLNTMIRTLSDVFPYVLLFVYKTDIMCIASQKPIQGNEKIYAERMSNPELKKTLERIDIDNPYGLFCGYIGSLPEGNGYFATAQRNTDDNLRLEYLAAIGMYRDEQPIIKLTISSDTYLAQCRRHLFPDTEKMQLLLQLCEQTAKIAPWHWYRLQSFAVACKDENDKQTVMAFALKARELMGHIVHGPKKMTEAKKLIKNKEWQAAEQLLRELFVIPEQQGEAYRLLGEINAQKRDFQAAFDWYARALQTNPDDYVASANIGLLCFLAGKIADSDNYFELSLQLNPYYVFSRGTWVNALRSQGRMDDAERLQKEGKRLLRPRQYQQLEEMIR